MTDVTFDLCGGPGGWDEAARRLRFSRVVGIEWDAAACRTRAAAGHATIRADVSRFPVEHLPARIAGLIGSPPCKTFSMAGSRAGTYVTAILSAAIEDAFAGRHTRAARRRAMAAALRDAWWPSPKLTRAARMAKIWAAVREASLVIEPARFIHACDPQWVALEQVPAVLPLWRTYAQELRKLGYSAWCGKLNAADYGVPQTRERAILIASRAHTVRRPEPTHYDPRKGMQLWGTPWVSMAEALGWGATERAAPTVTAGGTNTGGAEPFGHRDRDALAAEMEAGNWLLHTNRGQDEHGDRQIRDPRSAPALTGKSGGQWVLRGPYSTSPGDRTRPRTMDQPATTVAFGHEPHAGVAEGDGGGGQWSFRNNNNNNACTRSLDEPAGTLFFSQRSNWAAWVKDRPATTVQGDPRVGRPGHKDRDKGEAQFAQDSVRISVEEAAALQSFPPGYPWQGTKTKQYEQVGNAFPPLLAEHVLAMAAGIKVSEVAA